MKDACLDRITLKGESIEQCLESYPERAAELEPLLRAALSVKVNRKSSPIYKTETPRGTQTLGRRL